jgi:hypothetical protein
MLIHIGFSGWPLMINEISENHSLFLVFFPLGRGFHIYTIIHQHERGQWVFVQILHISLPNLTQERDEL